MLWQVVDEEGHDWDLLMPYVLLAIQETSQASTGFTPFELLFSRRPRGPVDMAKEDGIGTRDTGADQLGGPHHQGTHPGCTNGTTMHLQPSCTTPRIPAMCSCSFPVLSVNSLHSGNAPMLSQSE